ncbi:MAG: hypothetical protein ABIQ98_03730 [Sphingomicrobium sp.]
MDDGLSSGAAGANGPDELREARTNLFIAAVLQWSGGSSAVTVRNLSASGALVEAGSLPPAGSVVRLVRGTLAASGTVAWSEARRCGIRLDGTVVIALWMAKPCNLRQAEIDEAVRRIKAGGSLSGGGAAVAPAVAVAPAGAAAAPGSDQRSAPDASLADRVRALEALLVAVSDDLAADPATVARHAGELQKLDLLAQGLARLRG